MEKSFEKLAFLLFEIEDEKENCSCERNTTKPTSSLLITVEPTKEQSSSIHSFFGAVEPTSSLEGYTTAEPTSLYDSVYIPKDKYFFTYFVFLLLGIANLLPWNIFMTATDVCETFTFFLDILYYLYSNF